MSAITATIEQFTSRIRQAGRRLQIRVLGANNEQLDFIMDSFYKLSPRDRSLVLAGGSVGIGVLVLLCVFLYFNRINALEKQVTRHAEAIFELKSLKGQFKSEDAMFSDLQSMLSQKLSTLRVKPFIEKIAKEQGLLVEGLVDQRSDLPNYNPLSQTIKEVKVDFRLSKVSIPKLLNFLIEIEKSDSFLRVTDLKIQERFGTKLFFDVQVKISGYVTSSF